MCEPIPEWWIDVSAALTQRAGIARYVRGLTEALVQMHPAERGFAVGTYSSSWNDASARPFGVPHVGITLSARQWRLRVAAGHLMRQPILPGLPANARFLATDLTAFPHALPDHLAVTVHDLTAITHPQTHSLVARIFARFMVSQLARHQCPIIAVSRRTAAELIRIGGISPARITVIHPGVAAPFLTPPTHDEVNAVLKRHDIQRPFAIAVGTLEPRKNLRRLITAFQHVARPGQSLIMVGARGWGSDASIIDEYRGPGSVRAIGHVPDTDLACLYHACAVHVLPSLSEGFGSPAIEAHACGAPVICSRECGVIELLPQTTTIIDPRNIDAMATMLRTILSTPARARTLPPARTYAATASEHIHLLHQQMITS